MALLEPSSWVPIAISALALTVAVYGVFERRWGIKREYRGQFASTAGDLLALSLEEARETARATATGASPDRLVLSEIAARRALLTQQAASLDAVIDDALLTAEEYATIAGSFQALGDFAAAHRYWLKATERLGTETGTFMSAGPWRGLAWCAFELHRYEQGRQAVRTALSRLPQEHDRGKLDYLETLLDWEWYERLAAGDVGIAEQVTAEASQILTRIDDQYLRDYAAGRMRGMESATSSQPASHASSKLGRVRGGVLLEPQYGPGSNPPIQGVRDVFAPPPNGADAGATDTGRSRHRPS